MAPDGPRWPPESRGGSVSGTRPGPLQAREAYYSDLIYCTDHLLLPDYGAQSSSHLCSPAPPLLGALSLPSCAWATPPPCFSRAVLFRCHTVKCAVPPVAVRIKGLSFTFPSPLRSHTSKKRSITYLFSHPFLNYLANGWVTVPALQMLIIS